MPVSAGTAYVDILPNLAGFAAATAGGMRAQGKAMRGLGRSMAVGLTLPLVGAGVAVSKLSLSFADSMTNIRALVGASDKQLAKYKEGILELGQETTKGPNELAEALYFVASSGFEGAAALRVLQASARASASGLGSTSDVARVVGSAVNAYGEQALSAKDATDVLVASVREGTAEPAELATALGRVISPAEAVGVSFGEVGGAVAGLTLTGLNAAEAVTGLRGVLVSFLGPGTQAKDTLKEFGLSAKGIQEDIEKKGLLVTLQKLRDTFGENRDAMRKVFPNVRAFNAFLSLTGRNADKNAAAMRSVVNSTGDADKAFQKASESIGFRLRNALARLQVSMIKFGDILLPIVVDGIDKIAGLGNAFAKLNPTAQKFIVWAGIAAAALGPVLFVVGALTQAIGTLLTAFVRVSKTATGALAFQRGWALALATNPWFLAAAAIAAVTAAVVIAGREADATTSAIRDLTDSTREYVSASAELNQSSRDLTQAQIDEERTALAVKEARRGLVKVSKDEHSTALQVKQARLGVQQATLDHASALARLTEAQNNNRTSQKNLTQTRGDAQKRLGQLNALLMTQLGAMRRTLSPAERLKTTLSDLVQRMKPQELYKFVDGITANAAAFGKTRAQASLAREQIADFIRTTGRIPTRKELQVIVGGHALDDIERIRSGVAALHDKTVTITLKQRGSTAPIGTNAGGTDDWSGGWSWVGEEGPELLNLPRHSQVVPNGQLGSIGGDRMYRMTMTNWEEGVGFIEEVSDESVKSNNTHIRSKSRMRRRKSK